MVDGGGDRAEHWNRLGIYPGKFEGILYYCVLVTSSVTNDMLATGSGWVVELEKRHAVGLANNISDRCL